MFPYDETAEPGAINGNTKIVGIYGDPVKHSLSPAMHNAAFRARGLNYCYLPFLVRKNDLPAAMKAIISLNMQGVNITAPHKEAAVPFLHELSSEVTFLRAVNTIVNREGKLTGYNTDVDGFLCLLQNNFRDSFTTARVLLLGAGGAAKAVALALGRIKVKALLIANRTAGKAEMLATLLTRGGYFNAKQVNIISLKQLCRGSISGITWIINALSEDPVELGLLLPDNLPGCSAAIDLRYGQRQTPFEKWAKAEGIPYIDGLGMLLGQGVKAFEIFTGAEAPLEVMQDVLRNNRKKYLQK